MDRVPCEDAASIRIAAERAIEAMQANLDDAPSIKGKRPFLPPQYRHWIIV